MSDRIVSRPKRLARGDEGIVRVADKGIEHQLDMLQDAIQGSESPLRPIRQFLEGEVGISGRSGDAPVMREYCLTIDSRSDRCAPEVVSQ